MSGALFLFPEHLLDDSLRAYTRMIASGEIQSRESSHSVPADEKILKGSAQGMTNVQSSCDVRWRDCDGEAASGHVVAMPREVWFKETLLRPPRVPGRLDDGGNVRFVVWGIERPEDYVTRCRVSL